MKLNIKQIRILIREEISRALIETKFGWDQKNKDLYGAKNLGDKTREMIGKQTRAIGDLTKTFISPYDKKVRLKVGDYIKEFSTDNKAGKILNYHKGKIVSVNANGINVYWLDSKKEELYSGQETQELIADGEWELISS